MSDYALDLRRMGPTETLCDIHSALTDCVEGLDRLHEYVHKGDQQAQIDALGRKVRYLTNQNSDLLRGRKHITERLAYAEKRVTEAHQRTGHWHKWAGDIARRVDPGMTPNITGHMGAGPLRQFIEDWGKFTPVKPRKTP